MEGSEARCFGRSDLLEGFVATDRFRDTLFLALYSSGELRELKIPQAKSLKLKNDAVEFTFDLCDVDSHKFPTI